VALDGLARGLTALGHTVDVRPLGFRSGFHTLDRWLYNAGVARRPPTGDLVVGVDLDGFLWARRRHGGGRFVVALKGIIADELRNERGLVRWLLSIQARWERRNTQRADRVLVPSRYSADIAGALYGVPVSRLAVVPEPIDLAEWRRRFDGVRAGVEAERGGVLCVARLYPRKRVIDLLEAAALLRPRIAGLRIRIVGDGPEMPALRAAHARLALGDTVALLGHVSRDTLALEYSRARCFCLPTVQEGFGLVFAEAMAAGLPVVACRAAAVPEVVREGETGLLVEPRTPAALAAALERVLEDDGMRKEMSMAGRTRVEELDLVPIARRFLAAVAA